MSTEASLRSRPLHPALIAIPVGDWTVAAVLDSMEIRSGRRELRAGNVEVRAAKKSAS